MVGIDNLRKLVKVGAHLLNAGSKLIHHAGILGVLWDMRADLDTVQATDFNAAFAELKDLSNDERKQLEADFASELKLENPKVQAALVEGEACIEDAIGVVQDSIRLVKRVQALVSPA